MVLLFSLYSGMCCCSFSEGNVFWKLSQSRSYGLYLFAEGGCCIYHELKCALKSEFYSFSFAFKEEKSHIFRILCYNNPKTAVNLFEQETEGFCSKGIPCPLTGGP